MCERFQRLNVSCKVEINDIGDIITHKFQPQATCYGSIIIDSNSKGIHKWKFKIIKKHTFVGVAIGIDEANYKHTDSRFVKSSDSINYGYISSGKKGNTEDLSDYADSYGTGDIIKMQLNMDKKTLSFSKNTGNMKKAFKINDSNIGYSMCVYTKYKGDSVQLLSYNDNKIISNNKKQTKIEDIAYLKEEVNRLKNKLSKVEHEKKEIEIKYEKLKFDKDFVSLDMNKWTEWDTNSVYIFMINIENGLLKPYKDEIKKGLIESQITGNDLKNVDMDDIIRWGISVFSHRKTLQNAIKQLIENDYDFISAPSVVNIEEMEGEHNTDNNHDSNDSAFILI